MQQNVLDKGWVRLEEHMGGDAAVIRGARICYQSTAKTENADERLVQRLMRSEPRHNTVFEHAVFCFRVKCPLFVARQWMRHRIGTFNEKSLRYCIAGREYYVPAENKTEIDDYVAQLESQFDLYQRLVDSGWRREVARGVLGTAVYTEFVWTVNAWSLMNWLQKRYHKSAQWEHQQYADAILYMFCQAMPVTGQAFKEYILKR